MQKYNVGFCDIIINYNRIIGAAYICNNQYLYWLIMYYIYFVFRLFYKEY